MPLLLYDLRHEIDGQRVYENYSKDVKGSYDVIVIGSGMGGMSCASALANLGKKVLILEQHYVPGGFTHMFARKGYKWDVDVHVMGEMTEGELPYRMLMWLTRGRVKMNSNGDPFDSFFFPGDFEVNLTIKGNMNYNVVSWMRLQFSIYPCFMQTQ